MYDDSYALFKVSLYIGNRFIKSVSWVNGSEIMVLNLHLRDHLKGRHFPHTKKCFTQHITSLPRLFSQTMPS